MPRKENIQNIAKRKEQILKAAVTAFARSGLKDTSMNDIVRESGLSKGAIYWYYKSKDEIIAELLNEFFDPEDIKKVEAMLSTGTPLQKIEKLVDYMIDEMNQMRPFRPVIQELFVLAFRDEKIRRMTKNNFQASVALLQGIIEEGIKSKQFRRVDPYQVTLAIFEIFESTALFWSLDLIDVDFDKQLRGGINLILNSIKVKR
jgi:AcrR family transcriptional regulator